MGVHLNTYLYDWLPVRTLGEEQAAIRRWSSHTSPTSGFLLKPVEQNGADTADHLRGVPLDFASMLGRLSEQENGDVFLTCLMSVRERDFIPFRSCQRVSGFMASAMHLVRLGRLYTRPFTQWVVSLRIPPTEVSTSTDEGA